MSEDNKPQESLSETSLHAVNSEETHSDQEINSSLIADLKKELEQANKKIEDLSKRMLYLQSDLVNLQRQMERRISEARDEVMFQYIEELISIKEDLERAMPIVNNSDSALLDGLRMLVSRIDGTLKSEDVERMDVVLGSKLDVRLHEVVAKTEVRDQEEGTILSIVSNGYTVRGKVLRPALVEVAFARKSEESLPEIRVEHATEGQANQDDETRA